MTMLLMTPSLPADTTAEQDLGTSGQRRINLMWETTQAIMAVAVTLAVLGVSAYLAIVKESTEAYFLMSGAFFLVVGTYFQRTNHTKTGGISGPHDR